MADRSRGLPRTGEARSNTGGASQDCTIPSELVGGRCCSLQVILLFSSLLSRKFMQLRRQEARLRLKHTFVEPGAGGLGEWGRRGSLRCSEGWDHVGQAPPGPGVMGGAPYKDSNREGE